MDHSPERDPDRSCRRERHAEEAALEGGILGFGNPDRIPSVPAEVRLLMLMEKAYGLIKDDLITCRLAPGTMITERELSERHQTGKTPIRE